MNKAQIVERSIIKTYRKQLWRPFVKAIQEYELINEGDSLMVCISGGKDSFLLAKLIQEIQRHGKFPFDVHFVCMDPGYKKENRELIESNAKLLDIPLEIFETRIFDAVNSGAFKNPCYFCARMRRGYLYKQGQSLGCNKIVLGHHFDDVIETTLLSMFYGSEIKTMMPKLHSDNYEGMELIRPMYMIKEESVIHWRDKNGLTFLNCACKFTEDYTYHEGTSKRAEIKELIKDLRKVNPLIDHNIFTSMHNVNLDCVLKYKSHGKEYSFLDEYDNTLVDED